MIRTTATPHSTILRAPVGVRGPGWRSSAILLILLRNIGRTSLARVINPRVTVRVSEYEETLQMTGWYMYKRRPWVSMRREYEARCNIDDAGMIQRYGHLAKPARRPQRVIPTLLAAAPHLRRLNVYGCSGIDGDALLDLVRTQPSLFRTVEAIVHPAFLTLDKPPNYPVAITFMCACALQNTRCGVGFSFPLFTPTQVVQALCHLLPFASRTDDTYYVTGNTGAGLIISMCPSIAEHGAKLDIADANPKDPKPFIVDLSGRYLCP